MCVKPFITKFLQFTAKRATLRAYIKDIMFWMMFFFLGTVKPLFLTHFYPKREFDVGKNGRGILSVLSPVLSQYFFQESTLFSHTKSRVVKKEGNKG